MSKKMTAFGSKFIQTAKAISKKRIISKNSR